MKKSLGFIFILLLSSQSAAIKIDRVIVASDTNPMYLDFWPIIAHAWTRLGIRPTLALIADENVKVDESIGDVIRFKPIPGINSGFYAQTIRLLLPIFFEQEVSIISDIDMIPISTHYFTHLIPQVPDDKFVVYRDIAYGPNASQYPMCYNAAKGSTFKEVFGINSLDEIPGLIHSWFKQYGGSWSTDEIVLFNYLNQWTYFKTRCIKLGLTVERRIDRSWWHYDENLLKQDYYIDCHSIRPYLAHKAEIDKLARLIGINVNRKSRPNAP